MVSGSKLRDEVALRHEKYYRVGATRGEEGEEAGGVAVGGAPVNGGSRCCWMSASRDRVFLVGIGAVFLTALV